MEDIFWECHCPTDNLGFVGMVGNRVFVEDGKTPKYSRQPNDESKEDDNNYDSSRSYECGNLQLRGHEAIILGLIIKQPEITSLAHVHMGQNYPFGSTFVRVFDFDVYTDLNLDSFGFFEPC